MNPTTQSPGPGPRKGGFTLVELLVTIAILLVLAALAFVIAGKAMRKAGGVRDMATMRQIHNTVILYAGDHNDLLPGPINTGVKAVYGPPSTGRLSYYIAGYLGYNNPKRDEFLDTMGYSWQRDEKSRMAPCCYIRERVLLADGSDTIRPFGHPLRSGEDRRPKRMTAVFSQIDPGRTWMISDLDQQHPDIGSPDWRKDIPPTMTHDNYRIVVYFDGRSGKVDVNNEPL